MKPLVVYDSWYGNTREIAEVIATKLGKDVRAVTVTMHPEDFIRDFNLLVVGCPTHGGTVTPAMQDFLKLIEADDVHGMSVATFDTRVRGRWLKVIGFASQHIARQLEYYGGELVVPPEGFYVHGKEGPLLEGEIARAKSWATTVIERARLAHPAA